MMDALKFDQKEQEIIKRNMDKTPDHIFDIHSHVFLNSTLQDELKNTLAFNEFSFQDLQEAKETLYPWKDVEFLSFPQPQKSEPHIKNNNDYVKSWAKNKLLFWTINTPIQEELADDTWSWIKVYGFNNDSIQSNISLETLEILNQRGAILLIHLPVNIIVNQQELWSLLSKYKNIKFVVAHGWNVQKCKNNYEWYKNALQYLRRYENLGFDVSCVNDKDYMELLLDTFDINRIYYWSDLPISLLKWAVLPWNNWQGEIITKPCLEELDNWIREKIIKAYHLDLDNLVNIQQYTISLLWELLNEKQAEKVYYENAKNLNI